jgi:hypothetical protein
LRCARLAIYYTLGTHENINVFISTDRSSFPNNKISISTGRPPISSIFNSISKLNLLQYNRKCSEHSFLYPHEQEALGTNFDLNKSLFRELHLFLSLACNPLNLRNRLNISQPSYRLSTYRQSYFPTTIKLWNTLDLNLRQLPTLPSFKSKLQQKCFQPKTVPSYFSFGDRYLSVLHARLRNKCSSLNSDLFKSKLVPYNKISIFTGRPPISSIFNSMIMLFLSKLNLLQYNRKCSEHSFFYIFMCTKIHKRYTAFRLN